MGQSCDKVKEWEVNVVHRAMLISSLYHYYGPESCVLGTGVNHRSVTRHD